MHGSQDVSSAIPSFQSKQLSANANFPSARLLSGESHEFGYSDMDVSGPQLSPEVSDIMAQFATNVRKRLKRHYNTRAPSLTQDHDNGWIRR